MIEDIVHKYQYYFNAFALLSMYELKCIVKSGKCAREADDLMQKKQKPHGTFRSHHFTLITNENNCLHA